MQFFLVCFSIENSSQHIIKWNFLFSEGRSKFKIERLAASVHPKDLTCSLDSPTQCFKSTVHGNELFLLGSSAKDAEAISCLATNACGIPRQSPPSETQFRACACICVECSLGNPTKTPAHMRLHEFLLHFWLLTWRNASQNQSEKLLPLLSFYSHVR